MAVRIDFTGRTKELDQALKRTERRLTRFKRSAQSVDKALSRGLAVGGAAAAAGLAKAAQKALEFERQMSEVGTLLPDVNRRAFGELTSQVEALSVEMGIAATDVAPALYDAISAGVPRDNVVDFLRTASKTAIGGVTELSTAADALTTVLNTWGKSAGVTASRAADVLFTSVRLGKTTMDELGSSINQVAGLASSFGIQFENVAAAFTEVTKAGVPTAEAMTKVRALIQSVSSPAAKAVNAFKDLGIEVGAARVAQEGLLPVTQEIIEKTRGNEALQRKLFGSVEALQAALVLTSGSGEEFSATLAAMEDATGATDAAFERMEETVSRKWARASAALEASLIAVGNEFLPLVADALERMSDWLAENQHVVRALAAAASDELGKTLQGLAKVAGEVVLPALEAVGSLLEPLGVSLLDVTLAVKAVTAALAGNPFGAAAVGLLLLARHWDEVKAAAQAFARFVLESNWTYIAGALFGPFGVAAVALIQNFSRVVDAVEATVNTAIDIINGAARAFNKTIGRIPGVGDIPLVGKVDFSAAGMAFDSFTSQLTGGMDGVAQRAAVASQGMSDAWSTAGEQVARVNNAVALSSEAAAQRTVTAWSTARDAVTGGLTVQEWETAYAARLPGSSGSVNRFDSVAAFRSSLASRSTSGAGSSSSRPLYTASETGEKQLKLLQTVEDWSSQTLDEARATAQSQLEALTLAVDADGRRTLAEISLLDSAQRQIDLLERIAGDSETTADATSSSAVSEEQIAEDIATGLRRAGGGDRLSGFGGRVFADASAEAQERRQRLAIKFLERNPELRLARGGVVTRPTRALIGEAGPEAVIPLGRLGGRPAVTVNVRVDGSVLSEADLADVVVRAVEDARLVGALE